jgi:hypothetical protein
VLKRTHIAAPIMCLESDLLVVEGWEQVAIREYCEHSSRVVRAEGEAESKPTATSCCMALKEEDVTPTRRGEKWKDPPGKSTALGYENRPINEGVTRPKMRG